MFRRQGEYPPPYPNGWYVLAGTKYKSIDTCLRLISLGLKFKTSFLVPYNHFKFFICFLRIKCWSIRFYIFILKLVYICLVFIFHFIILTSFISHNNKKIIQMFCYQIYNLQFLIVSCEIYILYKRSIILDQHIARHFMYNSECLSNPPSLLYNSNN